MSVYVIAQISIHDRAVYEKYQSQFIDVFKKFDGKLLAADLNPQVVEGDWNHEKVVLMEFPDENAFQDWASSPDYQEIAKDRHAGSNATVLLVRSINF